MFNIKKIIARIKLAIVRKALAMVNVESYIYEDKKYDFICLCADLWNCESGDKPVSIGIGANTLDEGYDVWESYADPHSINWDKFLNDET